jgi:hypothetical protein
MTKDIRKKRKEAGNQDPSDVSNFKVRAARVPDPERDRRAGPVGTAADRHEDRHLARGAVCTLAQP